MTVLVDMEQVTVGRVGRVLFEGLSMTVADGQRVGVVGVNGTGKSTLLRVLAGKDVPDAGVVRRGRGTRIGFLDQEPELPDGTVQEAVGEGWEAEAALSRLGLGPQMGTSTGPFPAARENVWRWLGYWLTPSISSSSTSPPTTSTWAQRPGWKTN